MDRWHIEVSEQTSTQETEEAGDKIPYNIVNNYFSIGVVSVGRLFSCARFAIYWIENANLYNCIVNSHISSIWLYLLN